MQHILNDRRSKSFNGAEEACQGVFDPEESELYFRQIRTLEKAMGDFKLQLGPADKIVFTGKRLGEVPVPASFKITNALKERIAFKVKCTSNEMFRIWPPVGALKPDENVTVSLKFNAGKTVPVNGRHYFAVYYIKAADEKKKDEKKDDKREENKDDEKKEEKKEEKKFEEKKDEKKNDEKNEKKDEKKNQKKDDEKKEEMTEEKKDEEKRGEKKDDDKKDDKKDEKMDDKRKDEKKEGE
ncbi:hypothetical protein KIN20_019631 [Parelaphostrongylus tenuis]|uniref:Major sperm protein n=1 Tax=Parelaphostrongylus tenuis TaxID=148309 RepID=A0AAD5N3B2_PARTN|nr:hypothetical protein KIN20_019631 [Parelaphostrongylus tenuis]